MERRRGRRWSRSPVARAGSARRHVVLPGMFDLGACGSPVFGDVLDARNVDVLDRCQRPACRDRWPASLSAVS